MPSTLSVTSSADLVTQHGTLRWAVANAHNGDTILVNHAVQTTGITLTQGELLLNKNVTIETNGNTPVTINGGTISRVFEVAAGAQVTLHNVKITGGNGLADNPAGDATKDGNGGGILVDAGADLTVLDSTVSGNYAEGGLGGGIFNYGTVTVRGSTVSGNSASYAGGIFNSNWFDGTTLTFVNSTLTILNSSVSGNSAFIGGGGITNTGTAIIRSSTVSDNTAVVGDGGGIWNEDSGILTIRNSTLSSNSAVDGSGGGIFNDIRGMLTVRNSTLSGNSSYFGGGIANYSGTVKLSGSTLTGNFAGDRGNGFGGGIYNQYGTVNINRSTLFGNSAQNDGGGIWNGGTMTVRNSSLTDNFASISAYGGYGGGIYNIGTLTVSHSTLTRNSAAGSSFDSYGGGIANGGTLTVINFSSIHDNIALLGNGADVLNGGVLYKDISSIISILDGNPALPI